MKPEKLRSCHEQSRQCFNHLEKYVLTYPGAIILALGIILLFWIRPYKKKDGSL